MSNRDNDSDNAAVTVIVALFIFSGMFLLTALTSKEVNDFETVSDEQAFQELQERLIKVNENDSPAEVPSHEVYRALRDSKELTKESKRVISEAEILSKNKCLNEDGFDYTLKDVVKEGGVWYYKYEVYYKTSFVDCSGLFRFNFQEDHLYHIGTYRFNWKAIKGYGLSRGELRLGDVTLIKEGEGFIDR